jgi:hypothetical protein
MVYKMAAENHVIFKVSGDTQPYHISLCKEILRIVSINKYAVRI